MAFFSGHANRPSLVIDLGSHFIKSAVFEKPAGTSVIPQNVRKTVTRLAMTSRGGRAFASLHELLAALIKEHQSPEKIVIGISPNSADIALQQWKIDSPRVRDMLTPAHLRKYFQQLFSEHHEGSHAFLGYPISVEINGYPIMMRSLTLPDPSAIKEITVRTVTLRFSDEAGSAFGDLRKMFAGMAIEYIPLQAVMAEVLAHVCNISHGLLIDVGGSVTTLMLIFNGELAQIVSFPIGTDRFSHRIVKTRGGRFVEAEDTSRQYAHGLMSKEEQMKLSHIFSEEMEEWKKAFMQALESCYPVAPLPEDFYLYGGGSYFPEIRSALWSRDVLKNFSPFESPNVHIVQPSRIFDNDSLQGAIGGPEDVGLASLIYYSLHHTPLF